MRAKHGRTATIVMLSIVVALVGAGAGVASASAEPLEAPPVRVGGPE
ncbi:hypothetical protein SDC9_160099 [bioreactor metagenome]|uniref:Uncharacterized protein n=1 Tax=bioreactor metagenome TaxID=1076179 RepID=A0A645FHF7_9ZZZZ